jgi:hypothetical protein
VSGPAREHSLQDSYSYVIQSTVHLVMPAADSNIDAHGPPQPLAPGPGLLVPYDVSQS